MMSDKKDAEKIKPVEDKNFIYFSHFVDIQQIFFPQGEMLSFLIS